MWYNIGQVMQGGIGFEYLPGKTAMLVMGHPVPKIRSVPLQRLIAVPGYPLPYPWPIRKLS